MCRLPDLRSIVPDDLLEIASEGHPELDILAAVVSELDVGVALSWLGFAGLVCGSDSGCGCGNGVDHVCCSFGSDSLGMVFGGINVAVV